MRLTRTAWALIPGLILISASAADASAIPSELAATLSITVGERTVAIEGLTPGGTAIVLGVQREPLASAARVVTWARAVRDDDGDGTATLDLDRLSSRKSAWAALDLANGNRAATGARGFAPEIVQPGADGFEVDATTGESWLRLEGSVLQVLVVRSSTGAWATRAYDGGRGDADGSPDGIIRLPLSETQPLLPEYEEFSGLAGGDLIGAIDERSLRIYLLRGADASAPTH